MAEIKDGRRSRAYEQIRRELEPVETKTPRGFTKEEWGVLPYEEKLEFVKKKKTYALEALQNRLSSPVLSLVLDLNELETKMAGQSIKDGDQGVELSPEYMNALKLKIDLAKAIKHLTDKGIIRHEHFVKSVKDDDIIDIKCGVLEESDGTE